MKTIYLQSKKNYVAFVMLVALFFSISIYVQTYDRVKNIEDGYLADIIADGNDNYYLTESLNTPNTIGGQTFTSFGNIDFIIAKANSQGNTLWTKQIDESISGIVTDNKGNIYNTGTVNFGNTTMTANGNFIAKIISLPTVHYVNSLATGNNDGTSWDDAFNKFEDAISEASPGDIIYVAKGTYQPGNDEYFYMKPSVKIYGGFPNDDNTADMDDRDWINNETILMGNNNSVIKNYSNGLDGTAILDGFKITGGATDIGGGVYNTNTSPTFNNIIITENDADNYAGGMYNNNSSPVLNNVTISQNTANNNGGGLYNINNSNPILTNVSIVQNLVTRYSGGGIINYDSSPVLTNVTIRGNSANYYGGGICNYNDSSPTLLNVDINGNTGYLAGGGVFNSESSPTLTNVTISANWATDGGGIYNVLALPVLNNTIILGNRKGVYNNTGGGIDINSSHNLIQTGYETSEAEFDGNPIPNSTASDIFVNPLYPGQVWGDYRLKEGSWAIDQGDNSLYTGNINSDLDRDGNLRLSGNTIDLGAYEFPIPCPDLSTAPENVSVINSKCQQGCTIDGGSFSVSEFACPDGSHIQYSIDDGANWSDDAPEYNQTESMSIITRCSCNSDSNVVSPSSLSVTTFPGICIIPVEPSISINDYDCHTGLGGSITIYGCEIGLYWSYDNTEWHSYSEEQPIYDFNGSITIYAKCVSLKGCESSIASETTNPDNSCVVSNCPDLSIAPANVTFDDSIVNEDCTVVGGIFYEPENACPEGSFLQYSVNGGITWSNNLPMYKFDKPMTIITRCSCEADSFVVSPTSSPVTTNPGDSNACSGNYYTATSEASPIIGGIITEITNGNGTYKWGKKVKFKAEQNEGYKFTNWTIDGSIVSIKKAYSFFITQDTHAIANFTPKDYAVIVKAKPATRGSADGSGTYAYNSTATVTASANEGWHFVNWTDKNGNEVSTDTNYSFTVTGGTKLFANFAKNVGGVEYNKETESTIFSFNYYPNPVKDILNIDTNSDIKYIEVYNLQSQKIMSLEAEKVVNGKVNVRALPQGVYVFRVIFDNGEVKSLKVVKK